MRNAPSNLLAFGAILVAALATFGTAPVAAQTPDGLPPAMETVCDGETGSAFGLCNAYCEAMDCELANDNDPLTEPSASANACNKVRTKFQQRTGRDMPCEVTCPCSDNPERFQLWAAVLAGNQPVSFCLQDDEYCDVLGVDPNLCTPPEADFTLLVLPNAPEVFASSLGLPFLGIPFPFCGDSSGGLLPVDAEQGAFCKAQLDAALVAGGLTCGL